MNQQFRLQRFAKAVPGPAEVSDDRVTLAVLFSGDMTFQLRGRLPHPGEHVGVDGFLGPSEILVLADETGRPSAIAAEVAGRRIAVKTIEGQPTPGSGAAPEEDRRREELKKKALEQPSVQSLIDVFGADIQEVEEIDR